MSYLVILLPLIFTFDKTTRCGTRPLAWLAGGYALCLVEWLHTTNLKLARIFSGPRNFLDADNWDGVAHWIGYSLIELAGNLLLGSLLAAPVLIWRKFRI